MRTAPRFVSPADFKNYCGIDLDASLRDEGNELDSNKANMFLLNVEDRLMTFIDKNTFRNYSWETLSDHQLEHMQKAVLIQAKYIYRNGDLTTDSGYDPLKGIVAPKTALQDIEICQAAIDELHMGALFNHVMMNRRRWPRI